MTSNQPITLALTGGIACGKSEAGRVFVGEGFSVLDTDVVAHELMKADSSVFEKVVERFGESVVGEDGELDRKILGDKVFGDPAARNELNDLVHPAVIAAVKQWRLEQGGDVAVLVPLLFEIGWVDGWDVILCVSSNESLIYQRLEKRGLNEAEVRKRIAAQMPLTEKEKKSDFIIRNNRSLKELRAETLNVLERVRKQRK